MNFGLRCSTATAIILCIISILEVVQSTPFSDSHQSEVNILSNNKSVLRRRISKDVKIFDETITTRSQDEQFDSNFSKTNQDERAEKIIGKGNNIINKNQFFSPHDKKTLTKIY